MLISVYSFGYKFSGIPANRYGDLGGFVFDCRFLSNPYKVESLKNFKGYDEELSEFFLTKPEFETFVDNCIKLIKPAIKNYILRNFDNMQVSFGCTGGVHRSVYCSELFIKKMKQLGYKVKIEHIEI